LIAAAAASVNPIDWKLRSGIRQKDSPLSFPAILGRDVSGIVRAVGANVKDFRAGDRVLALSNATYAELVAVNDSDVAHLPDGVGLANAAAIPLISLTGDQLACADGRPLWKVSRRLGIWANRDERASNSDCRLAIQWNS
jgi:NADPH:quinone reductase-like Zn-dependent oxidoreductase